MEVGIYVPQVALSFEDIRHRAERCEQLDIRSLWLCDHLYGPGPGMPTLPSLEAWTLAMALLACTRTLRMGHLVLCNQFRHPALLAKMAATLDVVSGGRLDLGVGKLDRKVSMLRDHCERIGRDPASIRLSVEAVLALAPDHASLPSVREIAERRFGDPGFRLHDGGLVGTRPWSSAFWPCTRSVSTRWSSSPHDRASDETLELLSSDVPPPLSRPRRAAERGGRSSRLEVDDAGLRRVHMSNVAGYSNVPVHASL